MANNLLPPMPIGMPPDSSFWNDWYEKLRTLINTLSTSISWTVITDKPTTLAGYGITDAQTKLNNSAGLAAALSDETGTGLAVFNTSPTLVTPNIGSATASNLLVTTSGAGNVGVNVTRTGGTVGNWTWYLPSGTDAFQLFGSGNPQVHVNNTGTGLGTTTITDRLTVNGAIRINSPILIATNTSFTNGAGAAAGTLANAPTAGNPTKWIPINDNGTTRYIPAW